MCNKQHLEQKICELEHIKQVYARYITKYSIENDVENTTKIVSQNKHIKQLLRVAYRELDKYEQIMSNKPIEVEEVKAQSVSDEEISAIFNFNNDKRFTITE